METLNNVLQIVEALSLGTFIVVVGWQLIRWVIPLIKKGLLIEIINGVSDAYRLDMTNEEKLALVTAEIIEYCDENGITYPQDKIELLVNLCCAMAKLIKNKLQSSHSK